MENSNQDITVLVTGATGFIASRVVLDLLEAGYQVRGTVRNLERKVRSSRSGWRRIPANWITSPWSRQT